MRLAKCVLTVILIPLSVRLWAGQGVSQVDVPNASYTDAMGINNGGEIVGSFEDSQGMHGYVFKHGSFTPLNAPVSGALTNANGINDKGQVVGYYVKSGAIHGFVWDNGAFTQIDAPNANITYLHGINNHGEIVGHYREDVFALAHAFISRDGGFTPLTLPGVLVVGRGRESLGINDHGQVVGTYQAQGINHGFLWDGGGVTTIDVPGAVSTWASGINNRGQIVGSFSDAAGVVRGYLRNANGSITRIETPQAEGISAVRINDQGDIVGLFSELGGRFHGFLWSDSTASTSRIAPGF